MIELSNRLQMHMGERDLLNGWPFHSFRGHRQSLLAPYVNGSHLCAAIDVVSAERSSRVVGSLG